MINVFPMPGAQLRIELRRIESALDLLMSDPQAKDADIKKLEALRERVIFQMKLVDLCVKHGYQPKDFLRDDGSGD